MKKEQIEKYNLPVPRYTSYPPANCFTETFSEKDYREALARSDTASPRRLSFYLHIPFCRRLCYYCGCNAYPMRKPDAVERYVSALHAEIEEIKKFIDPRRKIAQIHYGGGTPTAIDVRYLKELNDHLLSAFDCMDEPEIAIECHPGYPDQVYWEELLSARFNRFSLGIQDFNREVLAVSNRKASVLPVEQIMQILRKDGAKINLDFIYGLPRQTADSFADTIRQAIALRPDRVVAFSYAHVPWVNKRQLLLEKAGLPESAEKKRMYDIAREWFLAAEYEAIGLDHFVRKDDELCLALSKGQLHRNFQGYCTRRTTGQVYALGATAISQLTDAYSQHTKDIDEYVDSIENRRFPVKRGYRLNEREQIVREVIEALMCNYAVDWPELGRRLSLSVEALKAAVVYDEKRLEELAADGLIRYDDNRLAVTEEGRLFVRNVAASFDPFMRQPTSSFSTPI